jgi:K+-transporting ATPase ATPase C chain
MKKIFFTSVMMILCFTLLFGIIYPAFVWAAAKLAFPDQANGSLIIKDGIVIGSSLIGQKFTKPGYFQTRPSAVDFNGTGSGGSNLAPTNPDLVTQVMKNTDVQFKANPGQNAKVPAELVCASSSGLDPQITKEAALWQVKRVAKARSLDEKAVMEAVDKYTQKPLFGFIGPEMVNVLEINLYLDGLKNTSKRG